MHAVPVRTAVQLYHTNEANLGFEADLGFELNLGSLEQRSLSRSLRVRVPIWTCNPIGYNSSSSRDPYRGRKHACCDVSVSQSVSQSVSRRVCVKNRKLYLLLDRSQTLGLKLTRCPP